MATKTKRQQRADWIVANKNIIDKAREAVTCPDKCRAKCGNGATCACQSGGGYGYWVQAFRAAGVECQPKNYWSGTGPTPSTSINRAIANYILSNAPTNIR